MAVQTSDSMKNKRVKLLDGTRVKIVAVLSTQYRLANDEKIPARKVLQKGKSFVETDLTMRELEDSGEGYVCKPEAEEKTSSKKTSGKKTKSKSKAKEEKASGKKTKSKSKAKEEKASGKKTKKPKSGNVEHELGDVSPKKKKKKKSSDEKTSKKSKKTTSAGTKPSKNSEDKAEKTEKVKRTELSFVDDTAISKIRRFIAAELREHVLTYHSNVESVVGEATLFKDDIDRGEIRLQIIVKTPKPEHHSLEYYLDIAKQAGANLKTPGAKLQAKLAARLELDEGAEVSVGDILDDEQGLRYMFAGILDKQFALVDIASEQVVTGAFSFFEGLDYLSDFTTLLGQGIEDVEAAEDEPEALDIDVDLDIEETDPLSSITDWTALDQDTMVSMIVANYSRDDILEFIDQHDVLELDEDDLELETHEIVTTMIEFLQSGDDSEEFEEDEDESEEVPLTREEMVAVLVEAGELTAKMSKRLDDEVITEMYAELADSLEEAAEELEEAEELSTEEMVAVLIAQKLVTSSMAKYLKEDQVQEMYDELQAESQSEDALDEAEELVDEDEVDEDLEDDIEDEDDSEDESEDEDDIEDEDAVEDEDEDDIEDEDEDDIEGDEIIDDEEFDLED